MKEDLIFSIALNQKYLKDLNRYAEKDRKKPEALVDKAVEIFLLKYKEEPPCSHCVDRMRADLQAEENVETLMVKLDPKTLKDFSGLTKNEIFMRAMIYQAVKDYLEARRKAGSKLNCPDCGSDQYDVRNHSIMWGDGEIHCAKCGTYIRDFDSG
ncbi:MAG: hypothetical protein G01um10143_673 [Parcubacteria group bacterium Gr01-1014_3]|nr:MAG: hypothetical protein G01um10143_673 [Parcubacteria group bacterium Gr01-1014_3]